MEFSKVLMRRASCRAYTEEAVSEEDAAKVLAAAQAAPVGMAAYGTVHLTVIRSQAFLDGLREAVGKFMRRPGDPIYGAKLLILVSAKPGMPPSIEFHNTGTIMENMLLEATDLGLGSVYLMGPVAALKGAPELLAMLDLPEGFVPTAAIALGHPAKPLAERAPAEKIAVSYLD